MKLKVVDLFCGAGGVTQGISNTSNAQVVACINHDELAIRSHSENHPDCQHYTEDIRLFDEKLLPKADVIWMSAECTHFSNAKGGEPRDADSRSLSNEIFRYARHCEPDYIIIENVREFLTWAPLAQKKDSKGNLVFRPNGEPYLIPDTDKNNEGILYREWVLKLKEMGYVNYRWKLLNSADFGAYTSRTRYFGIFSKKGFPVRFPKQTHTKNPPPNCEIKKWKAVKDLLDFSDKGKSIFNRKKPLSENTLKRIYAGLEKFIGKDDKWIVKFLSNNAKTGVNRGASVQEPLHTITTQGRLGLASVSFVDTYYGNGNCNSIDSPLRTITTNDRFSLVQPIFLTTDQFASKGHSLEKPHPTIIAYDKNTWIIQTEIDTPTYEVNPSDSEYTKKIKVFMREKGIADIYMRMLCVDRELKVIQGFPSDYKLLGTRKARKKFVGNSVVPLMAEKILESINQ